MKDTIKEDLMQIKEDIIDESPKKKRKFFMGMVLILLIALNSYSGYQIINYLNTLMVSNTINTNLSIDLKFGGKIVFEKNTFSQLHDYYLENQHLEFKTCLTGRKDGKDYYVTGLYFPKMIQQTVHSVRAEICNRETIISLHTHPYLSCIFSEQDMESFSYFRVLNPDSIYALMCDKNRFTFYGYETK